MSGLSIAAYFPFRRIKIFKQQVSPEATEAQIQVRPDKRFHPVCHKCGQKASGVHCWAKRKVRDLNMAAAKIWILCWYRKVFCPHCQGIHIEGLELFHPYLRVTTRFSLYVYGLCKLMTITDVAPHVGLNWKTVKAIDKYYIEHDFGQPDYTNLRILAVDEIAIRKGHQYLTVVLDYISGRVVYVGKDRRAKTLKRFFNKLSINKIISSVYILKDNLKHLWSYRSRTWATKALDQWCAMARAVGHKAVTAFAKTLERYRYGILNHCDFAIHTSKIEGVNNKIKVIKRKAYGFHDVRYFSLKIYQAFSN